MEEVSAHYNGDAGNVIVNFAALALIVDALIDGFQDADRKRDGVVAALTAKVEILETALAQNVPAKYLGIHKPGATYTEGSLVTRDGSIFHANKTTSEMPGDGCQDWTLAVKHDRDGKDAKR